MYKVLIVDDERPIREGIASLIPWRDYGFEITATACDGFEALAVFEAERPQLVLADIRMPEMDGFELIAKIRELDPATHVFILSGYAEFDYARKALSQKVDGYLLKPVDEDELIQQICRVKESLDDHALIEKRGERDIDGLRAALIENIIEAKNGASESIQASAKQCNLEWNSYQVLLIELDAANEHADFRAAKNAVRGLFGMRDSGALFEDGPSIGVLLRHAYQKDYSLDALHGQLSRAIGSSAGFRAAIGTLVYTLQELGESYRSARSCLEQAFFAEPGTIHHAGKLRRPPAGDAADAAGANPETGGFAAGEWAEQISVAIDSRNSKNLGRRFDDCVTALLRTARDEVSVKQSLVHVCSNTIDRIIDAHPELRATRHELAGWIIDIYSYTNCGELVGFVRKKILALAGGVDSEGPDSLVQGMMNVIEHNYSENLKLETLAGLFNYSSAYLGKLFKTHTGEYFNTYLDKVRVKKAIELLGKGLKVYRVSEMVGYAYVDYFHQKFRKYTGHSPSTFRVHS